LPKGRNQLKKEGRGSEKAAVILEMRRWRKVKRNGIQRDRVERTVHMQLLVGSVMAAKRENM
jgi:hypothetical protein